MIKALSVGLWYDNWICIVLHLKKILDVDFYSWCWSWMTSYVSITFSLVMDFNFSYYCSASVVSFVVKKKRINKDPKRSTTKNICIIVDNFYYWHQWAALITPNTFDLVLVRSVGTWCNTFLDPDCDLLRSILPWDPTVILPLQTYLFIKCESSTL